jgi:hypothetical protein
LAKAGCKTIFEDEGAYWESRSARLIRFFGSKQSFDNRLDPFHFVKAKKYTRHISFAV